MAENIALPIAIVLVVGFLGNFLYSFRSFYGFQSFYAWPLLPGTALPATLLLLPFQSKEMWSIIYEKVTLFVIFESRKEKRAEKLTFEEHCDHHMKQIPRATAVTAQPCQLTSDRTTNHYTFQSFNGIRANLYIIVYKYHNYRKSSVRTSIQMQLGVLTPTESLLPQRQQKLLNVVISSKMDSRLKSLYSPVFFNY